MRDVILAEQLTVVEVARALHVSDEGVRWLVERGQLTCERTQRGMRLFRPDAVVDLAAKRAKAALVPVRPPTSSRTPGKPRQLCLRLFRRRP